MVILNFHSAKNQTLLEYYMISMINGENYIWDDPIMAGVLILLRVILPLDSSHVSNLNIKVYIYENSLFGIVTGTFRVKKSVKILTPSEILFLSLNINTGLVQVY